MAALPLRSDSAGEAEPEPEPQRQPSRRRSRSPSRMSIIALARTDFVCRRCEQALFIDVLGLSSELLCIYCAPIYTTPAVLRA
eukprot:508299-Alexandrium_andersonii.AAC.1